MTASTATLDPAPSRTASAPAVGPLRVVSADDHPVYRDGIARALTAGAAGYLSKEAPRDEILATLDAAAQADAQPTLVPAERALLQLLEDGWTVGELPDLTGLDAGTIEQHLLDAAGKLGTRRIDDTLTRALARGLLD